MQFARIVFASRSRPIAICVTLMAAFSTVSVMLVADASAAAPGAQDDSWTPRDAARDALRVLEVAAGIALIVLSIVLPLAILAGLARAAARLGGRRRRERTLDAA